jgi:hypothetical protein
MFLLDRMLYEHMIVGPLKGGLDSYLFWARNPSPFHVSLLTYHGFNCGTAQENYRPSMLCSCNGLWSSIS